MPGHRLWIGAAGTSASFGIARSVRKRWASDVFIVAADINPPQLVAASSLADAYEQVLPVDDCDFALRLTDALMRHRIDTYFPILDEEILLALRLEEDGCFTSDMQVMGGSSASVIRCNDKFLAATILTEADIPTPKTCLPSLAGSLSGPLVLKPRLGRGSMGVVLLPPGTENIDLDVFRDDIFIAQEACQPPELTLDCFRSTRSGYTRVVCRERLEVKAGVCTKARVFEDVYLCSLASKVGEVFSLRDVYCIQVMRGAASSEWQVTDINPRPGAGTAMSGAAGVDFLAGVLAHAWGEDFKAILPPLDREFTVVRQYDEFVF